MHKLHLLNIQCKWLLNRFLKEGFLGASLICVFVIFVGICETCMEKKQVKTEKV